MNSSTQRSSPRRVVVAAIQLVLFLFVLDRGLYRLIVAAENSFFPDPGYVARFKEYTKGKSYDTLILGTSRTCEAVHPAYFAADLHQTAYKEAYAGRGPRYNYLFYHFFKRVVGKPKVVIYGVDYFMFRTRSERRWLARFEEKRRPPGLFDDLSSLLKNKKEIEDFLNELRLTIEGTIERRVARPDRDLSQIQAYLGRTPGPGRFDTVKPKDFIRARYPSFPGKEGPYLRSLIAELAEDHVPLILITIPSYIGTYERNFERRKFLRDLSRLIKGYPNAYLYDFDRPKVFPLENAEYFLNGGWGKSNSHLSKKGAEAFDRILLKKIAPHYAAAK